jgi:protein involved in sex pheromone biosynthesis
MRKTSTGKAETAAIVSAATDYVKKHSDRNMEFRITIEDVSGDFARARVDQRTDAWSYRVHREIFGAFAGSKMEYREVDAYAEPACH